MIIAVDGPAASGKGSLAKRLSAHYTLPHLDTGLLYRAVGQRLLLEGRSLNDAEAAISIAQSFVPEWLRHPNLRSREAGKAATAVAVIPDVRKALKDFQIAFTRNPSGAVLDGRDIGTVIAPHADVKLWVTANADIRANRRFKELVARGQPVGQPVNESDILSDLVARDANDAPNMIVAKDAVIVDTSALTLDEAFAKVLEICNRIVA